MEFRILGPLEVESDGRPLALGSRQPRALLAVLLLNANRVVSRDRLVDAIWGDEPPERAANALQVYVSQLRKELGREVIVTQQPGYRLDVGDGQLDLDRFEQLLAEARSSEAIDAVPALRAALRLWRGPALADLDDLPSLEGERRRLEELRLSTVEERIEAELALGEHASLVPELESFVREHPLRERPRAQLMLALYRSGRQAEALDVYQRGRRLFADELGLEPGEHLKQLERAILEQDPSLGASPANASGRTKRDVPTGTVTFLFADVEGSTGLMDALGDDYGELLRLEQQIVRDALDEHGGLEVANQGDAFFFAFRRARDAVTAAIATQRAVESANWPGGGRVRLRIGIHTGEPGVAEGSYHGLDVVRAARVSGAAHGGQILVSSATRDLVGSSVPAASFRDLGEHGLPEIGHPQRIFQVVAHGLPETFPPLRTKDGARVMPIKGREAELAAAAEAAVGAEVRRLRIFRRSRLTAVAGGVLVAGAAAAIALSLTQGGGEAAISVRPNSVAVVDPRTNRLVADVDVGSRPVAVAVGAGGVWVANADDGTVYRIDARTHLVTARIGIGTDVSDIAVGFGSVWVAGGNDSTLTRINPTPSPGIQKTLHLATNTLAPQPIFSVAVGPDGVWITRGDRLILIDPRTYRRLENFQIPSPIAMTVGDGSVWVTTQDERLVRYSPAGKDATSLSLPGPAVPEFGDGEIWMLVFLGDGAVWKVDPSTVQQVATLSLRHVGPELAVGEGAVWVVGDGALTRVDTETDGVAKTVPLGLNPAAVAAGEGGVWVAVQRPT